ncbi:MAG: hypothetical protein KIT31_27805 [Deltaproteobacteria bacterium]|nr:hypothetical protein [Deltaproteobacteria bacterium]
MEQQYRRTTPRIGVEAMCWELTGRNPTTALAIDVSAMGLCVERPYVGGPTQREVPLELEVPGIDEVMWARGDACFDLVVPAPPHLKTPMGLVRRTGYRIAAAATRDLRLLKEFVVETQRQREQTKELDLELALLFA